MGLNMIKQDGKLEKTRWLGGNPRPSDQQRKGAAPSTVDRPPATCSSALVGCRIDTKTWYDIPKRVTTIDSQKFLLEMHVNLLERTFRNQT